jgi:adenylate cyclase
MFERATELDPTYAEAYAYLGATYWLDWFSRWNPTPQTLERGGELAQKAVTLDESLSLPHAVLGGIYLWQRQYDRAIAEEEQAVALDPNDPEGYANLGQTLAFAGRPEEGISMVEKAMRLNPRYPPVYLLQLSLAYRMAGRYEEALVPGKKVLTLIPNSAPAHFNLTVIYSELGREEEARAMAAEMLRLNPNFSLEVFKDYLPFKDPAVLQRHLEALRRAGLK